MEFQGERLMKTKLVGVLATLMLGLSSAALANTIVVSPSPIVVGPVGGPFTWSYGVNLDGNSQINNGDFFTIFDFAGFIAGSQSVVAGWAASSALVGTCPAQAPFPALCAVADDPLVPNLTWTRTGGVILGPGAGASAPLGNFSAMSNSNVPRNDFFVSQDQDNQTVPATPNEGAGGNTNVPQQVPVPEPASLLLLGGGLLAVARARRKK
jgi:PEP-CTERM motif